MKDKKYISYCIISLDFFSQCAIKSKYILSFYNRLVWGSTPTIFLVMNFVLIEMGDGEKQLI